LKFISIIFIIATVVSSIVFGGSFIQFPVAKGQADDPLPVILIHGYRQTESSWYIWQNLLQRDRIPYLAASFDDDMCGSSKDHANELRQKVEQFKEYTGSEKINIVGFSKGGLDARVYLEDGNNNVENLIMIGTPNGGAPLASLDLYCYPAVDDLKFGSQATQATQNRNTNYYTIYGDWRWCILSLYGCIPQYGNSWIPGRDDGFVPVDSVNSEDYFINIDNTFDSHNFLQTKNEYDIASSILLGN
jgi:Palmitoyl protein thioesterase